MATICDKLIAEFHVGDRVRIREDIDSSMRLPFVFTSDMEKYRGMEFRVHEVGSSMVECLEDYDVYVIEELGFYGVDCYMDDYLKSTRYYLETDDGEHLWYSWSVFMFDLSYSNIEYETEDVGLLFI